ncbi:hypothetical protein FA048_09280 [Pedobacter polaris]|uniref:Lipoprotein n=1 Tax=Pedobacter polaris TaxID=2571273 RepID=A0A4U1CRS0_9SPHI|nr:hypothetical protein [Pedobacter polaris]TKC10373.1 hypothetical protein FA048_09280 [Pedobacter polaris]
MKRKYALLSLISVTLFFSSCSTPSYFIPAAAGNDVSYLPKPMESDSLKVKNYISASIAALDLPYGTGAVDLGFLNFSRGHTLKNINIAYGAYGFAGATNYDSEYNKTNAVPEFDGKGIFGGGLRTSIGYYDNAGNAEFRILSWENALSFESGNYADFRKKMRNLNDPNIISSTKTTLFTTGGATEIIWHSKRNYNNHFAFRLFYGVTPGLNSSLRNEYNLDVNGGSFDFSFYFKLNKLYGIFNAGANKGATSKLSLGYSF